MPAQGSAPGAPPLAHGPVLGNWPMIVRVDLTALLKTILEKFSRTGASRWGTKSGRVAHCKMVCVIHLENGYLPVVAIRRMPGLIGAPCQA